MKTALNIGRAVLLAAMVLSPLIPFTQPSSVMASTTADVLVTATPFTGGPTAPSGFTVTRITDTLIKLDWTPAAGANNTRILAKVDSPPTGLTDGYVVYYGNGVTANDTFTNLDVIGGTVYYAAFTENATGGWSLGWATGETEGIGMTLLGLSLIAVFLTVAMFMSKQMMLGFPCVIFWSVLGAFAYGESSTPWGDWQFFLFFGSMGMTIFSALAMYGLRTKKEELAEGDEFIDEGKDDLKFIDEGGNEPRSQDGEPPYSRTQAIRDRARRRREAIQRKEFR